MVRHLGLLMLSVSLSTIGQTLLKWGLNGIGAKDRDSFLSFAWASLTTLPILVGLVLFGMSVLVWMRVLAETELSWAYPILGLSYVMVALSGWLVFGDRLSGGRIIGIGLVLLGAAFIGRS